MKMNTRMFIEYLLQHEKLQENYSEEIQYVKDQMNKLEYDEENDSFAFVVSPENEYDTKILDVLNHLSYCVRDDNYQADRIRRYSYFSYQSLQKENGDIRKLMHLKNDPKEEVESKCECGEGLHRFKYKISFKVDEVKRYSFFSNPHEDTSYNQFMWNHVSFICCDCGKEYKGDDVCVLGRNAIVSATKDSVVFDNGDSIAISTFKYVYETVKDNRVVYKHLNYRIVFNLKTGRQYALGVRDTYNNKKYGEIVAINAYSLNMSVYSDLVITKITQEDFVKMGHKIQDYINDSDIIPFDDYVEQAMKQSHTPLGFISRTSPSNLKILVAYNANPYVPYHDYVNILALAKDIKINKATKCAGFYNSANYYNTVKYYTCKLTRNKNLLNDHDEYIKSLNISKEYADLAAKLADQRNALLSQPHLGYTGLSSIHFNSERIDDKYDYRVLTALRNESKLYNKIVNNKYVMDKIELLPGFDICMFISLMNNRAFTELTPGLFNKYAKELARQLVVLELEGQDMKPIRRAISDIHHDYNDIKKIDPSYKVKKLYELDELRKKIKEDLQRYYRAKCKIEYSEEVKQAFNTRTLALVEEIDFRELDDLHSKTGYYTEEMVQELATGDAIIVEYKNIKTRKVEYLFLDCHCKVMLNTRKPAYRNICKKYEQYKKQIKKDYKINFTFVD